MKYFLTTLAVVLFQFSGLAQNNSKSKEELSFAEFAPPGLVITANVMFLHNAMINADEDLLKNLTSTNLSYGHSNGVVQNQTEFIKKIVSGESDFVTMDTENETIEIVGDAAIVRHNLVAHTKDGGVDKDIKIGIMLVWQKQANKWLLIARQAFKLPTT